MSSCIRIKSKKHKSAKRLAHNALQLNNFLEDVMATQFAGQGQRGQIGFIVHLHVGFPTVMLHSVTEHALGKSGKGNDITVFCVTWKHAL